MEIILKRIKGHNESTMMIIQQLFLIDLDNRMINEVKKQIKSFQKRQFITGKEDASNNYYRGYTLGRNLIYDCLESILKEDEKQIIQINFQQFHQQLEGLDQVLHDFLQKDQHRIMERKLKKYFCIISFLINIFQLNRQFQCCLFNLYDD
ncbi:unnamed protein product [Paramecium pentaurelia]|uniref:Uncharacterized protein n=1 Tax=Paramecium pentaurelia TaxID=43138 RepID=A0A8S1SNF4_9CILI|nr:unnamed protein product [Paramecium pentaurelia]